MKIRWITAALLLAVALAAFVGCEDGENTRKSGMRGQESFAFTHNEQDGKEDYILNTSSHRIHMPSCLYAEKISEKNRMLVHDLAQALAEGYTYCSRCLADETDTEKEENKDENSKD